jgi:flavodoxin
MKSLVIYASTSGNTRTVAETIAEALRPYGSVELLAADEAPAELPESDLLLIGGPTEAHSMTRPLKDLLDRLAGSLLGRKVATFDTRVAWPKVLSGSAAVSAAKRLRAEGVEMVVPPESFIVETSGGTHLKEGELQRARAWAVAVADSVSVEAPVGAA